MCSRYLGSHADCAWHRVPHSHALTHISPQPTTPPPPVLPTHPSIATQLNNLSLPLRPPIPSSHSLTEPSSPHSLRMHYRLPNPSPTTTHKPDHCHPCRTPRHVSKGLKIRRFGGDARCEMRTWGVHAVRCMRPLGGVFGCGRLQIGEAEFQPGEWRTVWW